MGKNDTAFGAESYSSYSAAPAWYSEIPEEVKNLAAVQDHNGRIDPDLYGRYQVKRGLRDADGHGVLTGLTKIADVVAYTYNEKQEAVPIDGILYYRGYDLTDLIDGFTRAHRFGFEEVVYLLLIGQLPTAEQLQEFRALLARYRALPPNFVRDVIMKAPTNDMMNTLARSVLTLYCYDAAANDISVTNVMRQCLQLIANFPLLSVYGYGVYQHSVGKGLYIRQPQPELSTAENILYMLREDKNYTDLEARVLDVLLVLHADHGGGNNSTFTNHVVTSTGTDTYSAMAASLSSLKGPRHGGANLKVMGMVDDLKQNVRDWNDDDEIASYLQKLLGGEAFDRRGLIYGMGHAVYSISDPREVVLKKFANELSRETGRTEEMNLYCNIERLAGQLITNQRVIHKGVSANVDLYSGFVYDMLGIPRELFTPLFATARIAGWSAHRIEELDNGNKIIRPAYKCVAEHKPYIPMNER